MLFHLINSLWFVRDLFWTYFGISVCGPKVCMLRFEHVNLKFGNKFTFLLEYNIWQEILLRSVFTLYIIMVFLHFTNSYNVNGNMLLCRHIKLLRILNFYWNLFYIILQVWKNEYYVSVMEDNYFKICLDVVL